MRRPYRLVFPDRHGSPDLTHVNTNGTSGALDVHDGADGVPATRDGSRAAGQTGITHVKHASAPAQARRDGDARGMPVREYSLVVEGELGDELGSAFAGMTLTRKEGKTVLVGQVRDQAELQGLLQRISNLGLTLLSASTTEDDQGGES